MKMNRMKEYRVKFGSNQVELAKFIGCSSSTVSRYENNQSDVPYLVQEKVADFYRTTPKNIFGEQALDIEPKKEPEQLELNEPISLNVDTLIKTVMDNNEYV